MSYFVEEREQTLEKQFLAAEQRLNAYICSPLGAENIDVLLANMHRARAYMFFANKALGYTARAPHAYLPMLLCDRIPEERTIAIDFGIQLLERSEILLVFGDHISKGMKNEIRHAAKLGLIIRVFNENVYGEVKKIAEDSGGTKCQVVLDDLHPLFTCSYTSGILAELKEAG